jgi:hypothetical protein
LGVVVNIGLAGRVWPPRRRFLSVYALRPAATGGAAPTAELAAPAEAHAAGRFGVSLLPLALWNATDDTFTAASPEARCALAELLGTTSEALDATLTERTALIETLAQGRGAGLRAMREAVEAFYDAAKDTVSTDSAASAASDSEP